MNIARIADGTQIPKYSVIEKPDGLNGLKHNPKPPKTVSKSQKALVAWSKFKKGIHVIRGQRMYREDGRKSNGLGQELVPLISDDDFIEVTGVAEGQKYSIM
ncbi:hypothetical protein PTTG_27381 [Puccinia triticina 1-1 BBBD Race 1]|uniref:Uncharacterized protein n=2 Tax=Puccinia triticina TaxID=208348 RepID=A0A180GL45_PUCT1|nr:uncharacterized protein PtA15_11A96 [Puccinia triticina]OAV93188.1 hypothetical protein PTTG_27381 [Puccinia triticina 1-1 BBBD Race 1]WAQ89408.1 hypothetical protein PtA15_11A96 [Puccinia triticina]WAR59463.1 hypothetical protein PtB15_11B103 [Puccinia triticina]